MLEKIEKIISAQGWIVGSTVSYGDIFVAAYLDILEPNFPNLFDQFPRTKKMLDNVRAQPKINNWINQRQALTDFEKPFSA